MHIFISHRSSRSFRKNGAIRCRNSFIWPLVLVAIGLGCHTGETRQIQFTPAELTLQNFDAFVDKISPEPDELAWQEIAWESQLTKAIERANREDKPLLIWAMNGHPLGCT